MKPYTRGTLNKAVGLISHACMALKRLWRFLNCKIDALKEIIIAWGMNPEEILTKEALA